MAKKEKTLRDLDLRDLISQLAFSIGSIHMYTEPSVLAKVLKDKEFCAKLEASRKDIKEQIAELAKRFNAPSTYD